MRGALIKITAALEEAVRDLAGGYDPAQLYNLRVCIRRMRSLLKGRSGRRARRFRRIWGGFAAQTNPARDWDVFLLAAADLLTPAELREFERLNRGAVRSARQNAVHLVRSAQWRRLLAEWKEYLERGRGTGNKAVGGRPDLHTARDRAARARAVALSEDTDRTWHKLRIAIKELRYRTEAALSSKVEDDQLERTVDACKELQSALGHWHDTVVQLELLDTLPQSEVHRRLCERIEERRTDCLSLARQVCTGDKARLIFG
jgi:CHAD domain-containing protein